MMHDKISRADEFASRMSSAIDGALANVGQSSPRPLATALAVAATAAIGALDYITSQAMSFAIFYVAVVVLTALVVSVGAAMTTAAVASITWVVAEYHVRGEPIAPAADLWNGATRFAVLAFVVALVGWLASSVATARASERRYQEFLAAAAHQLRTPIAAMRSSSEALLMSDEPSTRELLLANIATEGARAGRLVASLLRLARADADAGTAPSTFDGLVAVRAEVERRQAGAGSTSRVILRIDETAPLTVRGSPTALAEALGNLLDNAARHAATEIIVGVEGRGPDLVITVTDDGPGIPAGTDEQIFERFVSLDGHGGSGLGLAIARELMRRDGGDTVHRDGAFEIRLRAAGQNRNS